MSQLKLKIELRDLQETEKQVTDMIRQHREGFDNTLPSWCRACVSAAKELRAGCFFRLEENADFSFQAVAVFYKP